jgi:hypothetical protein
VNTIGISVAATTAEVLADEEAGFGMHGLFPSWR